MLSPYQTAMKVRVTAAGAAFLPTILEMVLRVERTSGRGAGEGG